MHINAQPCMKSAMNSLVTPVLGCDCTVSPGNATFGTVAKESDYDLHSHSHTDSGKSIYKLLTEFPSDVISGAGRVTAPDDCSPWLGKCRLLILAGLTREMSERGRRMKAI